MKYTVPGNPKKITHDRIPLTRAPSRQDQAFLIFDKSQWLANIATDSDLIRCPREEIGQPTFVAT
jgi:hypothetical protein